MNLWLIIVIIGIAVYFLLKLALILLRPFFLAKFLEEIDMLYNKIKVITSKDIETTIENLGKWHAQDRVITIHSSEKDLQARIKDAHAADQHEKEVYEKFMRCKERFIQNPKELSNAIVAYKRYLEVKLKQSQEAKLFADVLTSGAMTFEEFEAAAKATMIILQENERKLDILLDNQAK